MIGSHCRWDPSPDQGCRDLPPTSTRAQIKRQEQIGDGTASRVPRTQHQISSHEEFPTQKVHVGIRIGIITLPYPEKRIPL